MVKLKEMPPKNGRSMGAKRRWAVDRLLKRSEHAEQKAAFQYFNMKANSEPDYGMIFAVPNGGERNAIVAAKLKAEGVKRGVPDLILPVPRKGFHGAVYELKVKPNKVAPHQQEWLDNFTLHGWLAEVCWSADELIARVEWYLSE